MRRPHMFVYASELAEVNKQMWNTKKKDIGLSRSFFVNFLSYCANVLICFKQSNRFSTLI